MSTIKSSAENLTLNADGANNDVIIQSNASTKVTVNGATGNVGIGDTTPTNAKLSIDNVLSGDAALAIKQDQANYGIDINQDGNSIAFHIDTAATTQPAIEVEVNALTTGKGIFISSNSADNSTRQLLRVTNDHTSATGTTTLYVDNDSTGLVADFHGAGGIRSRYGIKFGTDTAAANALDDYEEGTFTPTFFADGSASGIVYDHQNGYYTKIGKLVSVTVSMQITNKGSSSGNVTFRGLPFTVKDVLGNTSLDGGSVTFGYRAGFTGFTNIGMMAYGGTDYVGGYVETGNDGNLDATFTDGECTNNCSVRFSLHYFAD